ncbi:MAG TPA: hypothetical protein VMG59_06490 [Phycisphaerae bacterium]|nr:hypothetical protein [Phycisphaerae bacterium]
MQKNLASSVCPAALMLSFPLSTHRALGVAVASGYDALEQQIHATQQAIARDQVVLEKLQQAIARDQAALSTLSQITQAWQAQTQDVFMEHELYLAMLQDSNRPNGAQEAIADEAMVLDTQCELWQKDHKQLSSAQYTILKNELSNALLQAQKHPQATEQAIKHEEAILEKFQQQEDQQAQYTSYVWNLYFNAIQAYKHELDVQEAQIQSLQIQRTQAKEQAEANGPI